MYSKVTQDCKTIEVKKEDLKKLFFIEKKNPNNFINARIVKV
jgi:hypothetical protein